MRRLLLLEGYFVFSGIIKAYKHKDNLSMHCELTIHKYLTS